MKRRNPVQNVGDIPSAEEHWAWYEAAVKNPFRYSEVTFRTGAERVPGIAAARLYLPPPGAPPEACPPLASIVLMEAFFNRSPDEQVLTLLHECIHLSQFSGSLAARYESNEHVTHEYPAPDPINYTGMLKDEAYRFDSRRTILVTIARNPEATRRKAPPELVLL